MSPPEWHVLRDFLGAPLDAPGLRDVCGDAPVEVFPGGRVFVSRKADGLSMVFEAGPGSLGKVFVAFHLRSAHYEGFSAYPNALPFGIVFGDSEQTVLARCAAPMQLGGGHASDVLRRHIPRWARLVEQQVQTHFQFAEGGGVDLVTVSRREQ